MNELVVAFGTGDPDAVRAVYRQFARPVATVARSIIGNEQALIDDVVQQTFTKAWRAAASFDPGRDLAPWLYAIARRTAVDVARSERRPTRGDHEPEVDVAVAPESLERTWEAYQVRLAIDALPPDEAEVVRLSHLQGLSHPEIAERIGVPVGTVKSRSHRAHRRLAAALAHVVAEPPPARSGAPPPAGPENRRGNDNVVRGREGG